MAEEMLSISCEQNNPIKVLKWKVREGSTVSIGKVLFLYLNEKENNGIQLKFKSPKAGILKKIVAPEGAIVEPGELLYWLKLCNHPTIMNDMCAECGADLRDEDGEAVASVPMIHAIPDLKVSEEQAQVIGRADSDRLLRDRKLVLLVDLDQTLIHTTNDNVPANIKDVYHFQLYGPHSPWYHTRLRPGTHKFLENIFPLFELHICTFGTRNYAHMIATFLDRDQKYFSNRILSRDECFDPTSKKANLKALFPCGDNLVCIIDDREDVWSNASNLIHVKPYHFFRHTGDINAPPGLDKQENDELSGVDLSNLNAKKNGNRISNGINDKTEDSSSVEVRNLINEIEGTSINTSSIGENIVNEDMTSCENNEEKETEVSSEDVELTNDNIEKSETIECQNTEKVPEEKEESISEAHEAAEPSPNEQKKIDEKCEGDKEPSEEMKETSKNSINEPEETIAISPDMDINEKLKNCIKDSVELKEQSKNSLNDTKETIEKSKDQSTKVEEEIKDPANEEGKQCESDKKENKENENNETKENENKETKDNENKETKDNENKETKENKESTRKEKDLLEIDDPDSYLLDLECILKQIHKEFYERYDVMESGQVPDLKEVIPLVKSQVLKGIKMYFSGLVPTHQKLEQSKAYLIARSLGAKVTQDLEEDSTHLVAIRPGTAKVNTGKRRKNLKIVTPDWLWCCAERWEHVDERVFPLNNKGSKNRHPPPHCSSPTHAPEYLTPGIPTLRKRTPSGRFMDTINPLMSFSSDDIADMDKEVEDILDDESESDEDEKTKKDLPELPQDEESSSSSSSAESLDTEFPRGYKRSFTDMNMTENEEEQNNSDEDEWPSTKFRRGEAIEGIEEWESQDSQNSFDAPDEITDGEWNMMGAALEREFLSNE